MQFDEQVQEALAREAATLAPASLERVRRIDYRPRTHAVPPRLAAGLLAGGAAVAVALLAVGGGAGTQAAFAGWRATPTPTASGQAGAVEAQCAARLQVPPGQSVPAGKQGGPPDTQPQLVDTRGPFTLVLFKGATCISGPGFLGLHGQSPARGTAISTGDRDGQVFTIADGPAPADSRAVTLSLEDGSTVQASVGNSLFAAWWPSSSRPTAVVITTPSGTQTVPLSFPPAASAPAQKAARRHR
jgi:hypothetical protein